MANVSLLYLNVEYHDDGSVIMTRRCCQGRTANKTRPTRSATVRRERNGPIRGFIACNIQLRDKYATKQGTKKADRPGGAKQRAANSLPTLIPSGV